MIVLDSIRALITGERRLDQQRREAQRHLDEVTQARDEVRAAIARFLGDETSGSVDGQEVLRREPKSGAAFKKAEFAKRYPELAKEYTVAKVTEELDVAGLAMAHPDVYNEFRVYQWTNLTELP